MVLKLFLVIIAFTFINCVLSEFNLTIVHISDFHSNWFEFDENKHDCSKEESREGKCFGGFPRLLSFVRDIRKREKNVLVLSSGEFFLGRTLYEMHGWRPALALLPKLELDAMSLSNHDFDSGVFELSSFLYAMKFPVLCANMEAKNTSFLYSRINKSAVLDINGQKVGIVGYIHRHAMKKTKSAVSFKFLPEIPALQEEVSRLESEGIDKIIALGHAGYFTDLEIARAVKGIDVVMGGDSDIMLFDPGHDADEFSKVGNIHGNYPRIHHQEPEIDDDPKLANRTLVLHIPQHGMYVGVLRATFDDNGKIIHESGEPVLLDNSIKQDEETLDFLQYAKGALKETTKHARLPDDSEILGKVLSHLDGNRRNCRMFECSLGNFIVDALLHEFTFHYKSKSDHRNKYETWGPIDALVFNSGPILRSIEPGYITMQDIVKSVCLGSIIKRVYMSGQQLLDMMEHSVKHYDPSGVTAPGAFLQIAGLRVEYDISQPPGARVRSLDIRCRDCEDDNVYHPVKQYKTYIIGMPTFLQDGRDGYYDFEQTLGEDFGQFDALLIVEYLESTFHVEPKIDGRIKFYNASGQSKLPFNVPLLFGEPATSFNDKLFAAPIHEPSSETSEEKTSDFNLKNETLHKSERKQPSGMNDLISEMNKSFDQNGESSISSNFPGEPNEKSDLHDEFLKEKDTPNFKSVDVGKKVHDEISKPVENDLSKFEKEELILMQASEEKENSSSIPVTSN